MKDEKGNGLKFCIYSVMDQEMGWLEIILILFNKDLGLSNKIDRIWA